MNRIHAHSSSLQRLSKGFNVVIRVVVGSFLSASLSRSNELGFLRNLPLNDETKAMIGVRDGFKSREWMVEKPVVIVVYLGWMPYKN